MTERWRSLSSRCSLRNLRRSRPRRMAGRLRSRLIASGSKPSAPAACHAILPAALPKIPASVIPGLLRNLQHPITRDYPGRVTSRSGASSAKSLSRSGFPGLLNEWVAWLDEQKTKRNKPLADSTKEGVMRAVNTFMTYLVEHRVIEANPMEGVRMAMPGAAHSACDG